MLFSSQRAEKARHSHSTWSYIHGQRSRTSIATQHRTHTHNKNVHVPIGKLNRGQERCMKLKQPLGWPTTLALNERDEIPKSKWIKFKSMNFFTWLYVAHISIQADSLRWYWKTLKLNSRFDCVCVLCSVAYVAVYQIYASGRRRMKRRKKKHSIYMLQTDRTMYVNVYYWCGCMWWPSDFISDWYIRYLYSIDLCQLAAIARLR